MISSAHCFTSLALLEVFIPPPFPLPPACICAFTTKESFPVFSRISNAALKASSGVEATRPVGTGTPYFLRIDFPWYSCIFILLLSV